MLNITPMKFDLIIAAIIFLLVALMLFNRWKLATDESGADQGLGVKELIENVKAELIEAEQNRIKSNKAALFETKDFDLEINFVVNTRRKGTGKLEIQVVTIGGETEISSEKIQKIKLHMTAIPPSAGRQPAAGSPLSQQEDTITYDPQPPAKKGQEP
jgi:Trypsin-co-occurring domain 2